MYKKMLIKGCLLHVCRFKIEKYPKTLNFHLTKKYVVGGRSSVNVEIQTTKNSKLTEKVLCSVKSN